mmetsp:Transcript_44407/g.81459  ORF Transcript_44407/g.81459 Transcript_44407/m.81459 type:complete len:115 (-) Transcript_44407:37-381(-)
MTKKAVHERNTPSIFILERILVNLCSITAMSINNEEKLPAKAEVSMADMKTVSSSFPESFSALYLESAAAERKSPEETAATTDGNHHWFWKLCRNAISSCCEKRWSNVFIHCRT